MKRCPECRRDYIDDSLLYCLEDGTALIQGSVAAPDESETAILRETSPSSDAATQPQIRATDRTAAKALEFPSASKRSVDKRLIATPLLVAVILLAGMAGYRYLKSPASHQINSIAVLP